MCHISFGDAQDVLALLYNTNYANALLSAGLLACLCITYCSE